MFWLITGSFYILWRYVVGRGLVDPEVDPQHQLRVNHTAARRRPLR